METTKLSSVKLAHMIAILVQVMDFAYLVMQQLTYESYHQQHQDANLFLDIMKQQIQLEDY